METVAMFFVIASLLVAAGIAGGLKGKAALARLLIASVLLSAAILTKSSSIFAVPLLAYLAWRCGTSLKESIAFLAASFVVLLFVVGSYLVVAKLSFAEDYAYFSQLNLKSRMHNDFANWLWGVAKIVVRAKVLGIAFLGLTVFLTAFALLISQRYRRDPLIHVMAGYIVAYIAMLSLVSYGPPRYFLPLIVPFAALCATACIEFTDWLRKTHWSNSAIVSILPMVLLAGIALHGTWQIIAYMSNPTFSFYRMAHEVGDIIKEREGKVSGIVLFGHMADSVALEIGTLSVNTEFGTRDLEWKLSKYRPKYLLLHGDEDILHTVEAEGGDIMELASWDVYDNYYGDGQQVKLVFINWNAEAPEG